MDKDFANILNFPPQSSHGIVVIRLPKRPVLKVAAEQESTRAILDNDFNSNLTIMNFSFSIRLRIDFMVYKLQKMNQLLKSLIVICVIFTGLISCKKPEEVAVEVTYTSEKKDETLGLAMKNASRDLRRLSRSIENRDWVEIEMWAKELKEGIGYSCVELYMKEHRGVSSEFVIMGSRFFDAVKNLILSCKEHNAEIIDVEFNRLLTTCDDCHEIYKEKEELPFTLRSDL